MKAKKIEDPDMKIEDAVIVAEPLIKTVDLKKNFGDFSKEIARFEEYTVSIIIESDQTLVVAENNSSQINEILKNIEKVRKAVKEPYYVTAKLIDEYAKTLSVPLDKAKKDINEAITSYKKVQEAAARLEAEKIRRQAEALANIKTEEADRLVRVQRQLIARLYGGSWVNKEGQTKTTAGCYTLEDCKNLTNLIKTKVPTSDTYTYLKGEYNDMLKEILNKIADHKYNLINKDSESKSLAKDAEVSIEEAKINAAMGVNNTSDELTQTIVKEIKKEIKFANSEIKESGKGVRQTLKFEIDNIAAVPYEWITINETEVRKYAIENKERLKEKMAAGNCIENGIKFYLEDSYVSK